MQKSYIDINIYGMNQVNLEEVRIFHLKTNAQNLETWVAYHNDTNHAIGHIFMLIETDKKIKFMDAWVHPNWRRKGLFRTLWDTRWDYVYEHYKGYKVYAWCKESSLPLLLEKGFEPGEIVTYVEKQVI